MTPLERFRHDPVFTMLVRLFHDQFERCDQGGAGLTPTEVREASALAWQFYMERHPSPFVRPPS